jgi:hypothetical protein
MKWILGNLDIVVGAAFCACLAAAGVYIMLVM